MAEKRAYSDQFLLRFPDGLREQLKTIADQNERSLNAEIIARIQETLDVRWMARKAIQENALEEVRAELAAEKRENAVLNRHFEIFAEQIASSITKDPAEGHRIVASLRAFWGRRPE